MKTGATEFTNAVKMAEVSAAISAGALANIAGNRIIVSAESGTTDDLDSLSLANDGNYVELIAATGHTIQITDSSDFAAAVELTDSAVLSFNLVGGSWIQKGGAPGGASDTQPDPVISNFVAYYPFTIDGSDLSANENDAEIHGASVDKVGLGTTNGNNSCALLPAASQLNMAGGEFTISLFYTQWSGTGPFIGTDLENIYSGSSMFVFGCDGGIDSKLWIEGGAVGNTSLGYYMPFATKCHLILTKEDTGGGTFEYKFYLDNILKTTISAAGDINSTTDNKNWIVNGWPKRVDNSQGGTVQHLYICNRVVTEAERALLAAQA